MAQPRQAGVLGCSRSRYSCTDDTAVVSEVKTERKSEMKKIVIRLARAPAAMQVGISGRLAGRAV